MLFSLILTNGKKPSVSKCIAVASSDEMVNVGSFSELLQLSVNEAVTPMQFSSSPVKSNKRATPIQAADN